MSKKVLTLLGGSFLAAGLAFGLIQPLGVFIVTERLGLEKEFLKWLLTVNGAGMFLGGALVMMLAKSVAPQKLLAFGMLVNAMVMAISGLSTIPWLTVTVQFFGGLVVPCIHIGINTLILQHTDSQYVGRVNGFLNPLFTGAMVLTMSVSGILKEKISLVAMFEIAGFLFIVGLLFMLPLLRLPVMAREVSSD